MGEMTVTCSQIMMVRVSLHNPQVNRKAEESQQLQAVRRAVGVPIHGEEREVLRIAG